MGLTWFDIVIGIIVFLAFFKGYSSGLIMQLASLVGLVVGAVFAGQLASLIQPYLLHLVSENEYLIQPLSFIIDFILIMLCFLLVGKILHNIIKVIQIGFLNKLAGAVFSIAKWLLICSILLNIVLAFDLKGRIIKPEIREKSWTYSFVQSITPKIIPYLNFEFTQEEKQKIRSEEKIVI